MAENETGFDFVPNKKARSDVWHHFWLKFDKAARKAMDGIAICRLCDQAVMYSGGTTNLNTHLNRHHPSAKMKTMKSKTEVAQPVQDQTRPTMTSSPVPPNSSKKVQGTITGMLSAPYSFHSARASAITRSIASYIVGDLRPLSVVEGKGFQHMVKTLEPRYSLPGRTYFTTTLIPQMYEESVLKVKAALSSARVVALTTDGWTSRATESYVTVTSTHITPDWTLKNFVLQTRAMPESHTGVNIAGVIKEAAAEWGVSSYSPLVTDNAANMVVAAQHLNSKPHIGCFAHCLNLAAQKALKVDTVSRLLARVRKIVGYFHRSTTAAALLKNKISLLGLSQLKLIQDVPTRWNSAADMLERYLQLQPAIFATLVANELNQPDVSTLSEADSRLAVSIMECLLPLRDITSAICTEKTPTVSVIIPLMKKIQRTMTPTETDLPVVRQMKTAVTDNLSTRYASEEISNFLEECTVLDPRFKDSHIDPERLCTIYHRLPFICSAGGPLKVKTEPGDAPQPQQPEPQLPQLPQVEMDVDSLEQPPTANNMVHQEQPSSSTAPNQVPAKRGGLAAILNDVIIVKEVKGSKTPLEKATDEINRYKDVPK